MPLDRQSGVREDGGYVGKCTGCYAWYWNSWGAGTYCGSCLHGYADALKARWDDAEVHVEELKDSLGEVWTTIDALEMRFVGNDLAMSADLERGRAVADALANARAVLDR